MDVKDVRAPQGSVKPAGREIETQNKARRSAVALATLIPSNTQNSQRTDRVDTRSRSTAKSEIRARINEVINVTNVAADATTQISNLVKSIDGIVEQAKEDNITPQRRAVLEKEANELVDEIKKAAQSSASNGIRPLTGEKIRLEVEERIGRTLEIMLPDEAKDAFGLGNFTFSTKETIISTIANVKEAERSILKLREAVQEASRSVSETASSVEVALQNLEASEATIRDVDAAIKLAGETKIGIGQDPESALESVGQLDSSALGLLD
ncbi:MAG: hypothetical protein J5J00_06845 [Deltaproteobacteria bacterium]|nr:hypothetical protein [Deltaproteobacteria bacterium]